MATVTIPNNLKKLATLVQRIKSRNDAYAIDTGKDLLQAKAMLKHGEFGPWLKANFGWSTSTAGNYMNAAKLAEQAPAVAKLKPAAVVALAAPSTPDVVKSEVIADLEKGNVPTPKEIKAKIAAAKPEIITHTMKIKVPSSFILSMIARLSTLTPDSRTSFPPS